MHFVPTEGRENPKRHEKWEASRPSRVVEVLKGAMLQRGKAESFCCCAIGGSAQERDVGRSRWLVGDGCSRTFGATKLTTAGSQVTRATMSRQQLPHERHTLPNKALWYSLRGTSSCARGLTPPTRSSHEPDSFERTPSITPLIGPKTTSILTAAAPGRPLTRSFALASRAQLLVNLAFRQGFVQAPGAPREAVGGNSVGQPVESPRPYRGFRGEGGGMSPPASWVVEEVAGVDARVAAVWRELDALERSHQNRERFRVQCDDHRPCVPKNLRRCVGGRIGKMLRGGKFDLTSDGMWAWNQMLFLWLSNHPNSFHGVFP